MNRKRLARTHRILLPTLTIGLFAGCNVDGMRAQPRPPKGSVLETRPGDPTGRATAASLATVEGEEVDLVENVVTHRAAYQRGLEALRDYYRDHGYATKQGWADFELAGTKKTKAFRYILDSEIPTTTLRPTESIPEADGLYQRGMDLLRKGGRGIPGLYSRTTMVEAADAFQQLVREYPSSDKIDDAAFFLGEIHKEYLPDQEPIAVKWYERAWTWNASTPHPARFQAAVVYDFRLHDRDRALELYQSVVKEETAGTSNVRFSTHRIGQLIRERPDATTQVVTTDPAAP